MYITNCIFWRPPANRRPTKEEIAICKPFLEKHIALLNPKIIILVGATAANAVVEDSGKIADIKENFYEYSNKYLDNTISTTIMFHPAFLLRQPSRKKSTWYDLLKIKEFLKLA